MQAKVFGQGTISLDFEIHRSHPTNPYLEILKPKNFEMVPPRFGLADALTPVSVKGRVEAAQHCKSEFLICGSHCVCGPRRNIKVSRLSCLFCKTLRLGDVLWHSELSIQHCYCRGSGHCCGVGWIPGLGTSILKQTKTTPPPQQNGLGRGFIGYSCEHKGCPLR